MAADAIAATPPGTFAPGAKASRADWLAVMAGILGAFMAALDISVTNSSLPQIQGEIGATGTEGSWISTGYLAAEIIMIPLTAWLVRVLGMRTLLLLAVGCFTLFSVGCGCSSTLNELILCRVGQGFTGGALIPTAMTIVNMRLPPAQKPFGFALFGGTAVLAPVFGPLVGGWLTETFTWHYIFFLNLPVGAALLTLLLLGLPHQKSHLSEFGRADFVGIAGLALGLGGLTIVLEEGQREQWFESRMVIAVTLVAVIGAVLTAISQATSAKPVVKLRLILNRAFGGSFVVSLVVGAALYSVPFIIPVFLGGIHGYTAQETGRVVMISGVPILIFLPMMSFLVRKVDLRWLAALGLMFMALSCLINTGMTVDTGAPQLLIPQLLRGLGQALVMSPLSQSATASVQPHEASDATGLYSMARNLGGSLGLAGAGSLIDSRTAFHVQQLGQSITANSLIGQDYLVQQGVQRLSQTIQTQALVMAYADCFFVLGVALIAVLPLVLILRPLTPTRGRA